VAEAAGKKTGFVMATVTSTSLSSPADSRDGRSSPLNGLIAFWRQFFVRAFDPYRPELHYMRGPGPACRAKQVPRD
jgi:hypothetical protein